MNLQSFVGECAHQNREPITSEGGKVIASRCSRCHDMRAFRPCRHCKTDFEIPATGQPRKLYCADKCVQRAYRARKKKQAEAAKKWPEQQAAS